MLAERQFRKERKEKRKKERERREKKERRKRRKRFKLQIFMPESLFKQTEPTMTSPTLSSYLCLVEAPILAPSIPPLL